MKLHNSLTRQVQELEAKDGKVSIYSCGPTVYERAHIGNLSSFIYVDMLTRSLRAGGYKVEHVMNITDVDDKTIAKSQQEYPELEPMEALSKLTKKYEKLFLKDLATVGVDVDKIKFVRATDNIDDMQKFISELIKGGVAYEADDGIYFSISEYESKGKKYGQLVDIAPAAETRARIDNDEYDKDNPQDFVLWKSQKPGEPAWDFKLPDGRNMPGRPGWHIECSVMSTKCLGQPFDIHTGGVDLKFPHHENEIAQSTALNGDLLAKVFVHSEHMLIDNQKMSKSLNNFLTLEDITAKGFDPLAFRLFVLEGKYDTQRDFSWQNLQHSANRLLHWRQIAAKLTRSGSFNNDEKDDPQADVIQELSDDLNTPKALEQIEANLSNGNKQTATVRLINRLLGLNIIERDEKVEKLLKDREAARQANDWQKADEIRDELQNQGVGINDTPDGPIWFRL